MDYNYPYSYPSYPSYPSSTYTKIALVLIILIIIIILVVVVIFIMKNKTKINCKKNEGDLDDKVLKYYPKSCYVTKKTFEENKNSYSLVFNDFKKDLENTTSDYSYDKYNVYVQSYFILINSDTKQEEDIGKGILTTGKNFNFVHFDNKYDYLDIARKLREGQGKASLYCKSGDKVIIYME